VCGIAGIVDTDRDRPVDSATLKRMSRALRHRGPDDEGEWVAGGVGLAHTRLAVIDLSPHGRQPMCNEDGTLQVVFNGEIYNFRELRTELVGKGHVFRSETDTEVIVHLYEEHGDACVDRLEGMFAFAVWDARQRRLLLARDRLGKKPLKYAAVDGGLIFASELKAILATGLVEREVDTDDIDRFLSLGYVPAPGTGFAGIRKLPPAHRLVWEDGKITIERYWSLDFRPKAMRSADEWSELVRETVERAVARRLISDVPLGAFLSGGIDSSIVVGCMARQMSRPVETFSIGFDFEAYNELPQARAVAELYGTSHHELVVRPDAAELLPVLAELYEEPFADCSALPSYVLARETRREVTVALNGDGGDEGFVGYTRYARLADWNGRLDLAARSGIPRLAGAVAGWFGPGVAERLDGLRHYGDTDPAVRYGWIMRLFSERQKRTMGRNGGGAALTRFGADALVRLMHDERGGTALVDRMTYADAMLYLPDDLLVKVDLACMAHGLEARSPLLDRELLEVAASAPAELRYAGGSLKSLLKRAFRDELPAEVTGRPKAGFVIPLAEWFRDPLLPLARDLLCNAETHVLRYFRPDALKSLVERHAAGRADHGRQLWALAMLELWHRRVVAGNG